MSNDNNQLTTTADDNNTPAAPTQQQPPPMPFDIGAIFQTVQTLTQRVSSELKPPDGTEEMNTGAPPDIAKVFSSIGKVLAEPSKEMEDVKKSLSSFGVGANTAGSSDGAVPPPPAFNIGSLFSSILMPQAARPKDEVLHATHQDADAGHHEKLIDPPKKPITEKTVVLEVTEQELQEGAIKKFTIDVAEDNAGERDVFALELQLQANKYFYKFFLKERNMNLSFILDIQ